MDNGIVQVCPMHYLGPIYTNKVFFVDPTFKPNPVFYTCILSG